MNKTISLLCSLALVTAPAVAFAEVADSGGAVTAPAVMTGVKGKAEDAVKSRATREIDRRVSNIGQMVSRLSGSKNRSSPDNALLQKNLAAQISSLMTLKAKIELDADLETLKADVQSITKSYRIYALVLPQARVVAAANRVLTIVDEMKAVGAKLQSRLSASSTVDSATLEDAHTDMQSKLADASAQANAALVSVANLVPDNGDATAATANESQLKDARAKLDVASKDLKAAREDVKTILKGLGVMGGDGSNKGGE